GNVLKFYSSVRMDIRRIGAIKQGDKVVGNRTRVKVVKNKMAPPFREIEFDITYGEGVSREGMLIDLGVLANVVDKAGAWLSYQGDRIGQGRENAKAFLREHPEMAAEIEAKVLDHNGIAPRPNEDEKPAQPRAQPKPVKAVKARGRRKVGR
ncbi:MAG: DNA recombination/repair protein RecA, partial [Nannocystaceae bacterium]